MIKPIFAMLKANYKTQPTQIHKCSMHFPNTCAIRMSEALAMTDAKLLMYSRIRTKTNARTAIFEALKISPLYLLCRAYGESETMAGVLSPMATLQRML
jgi:hypothetical protein